MAEDFNKPTQSSLYEDFDQEIRDNFAALAVMLYPGANTPTGTIRVNATFTGFEKYNGATWDALSIQRGIDDTPVNGETDESITSNWAYDHENSTTEHGVSGVVVGTTNTQTLTNKTLTAPTITSPTINTSISGTAFLDQDAMTDDSATKVCSQQSIKAYVDSGTITMTNKTLTNPTITSPTINTSISGTAFLDQDAMTDNSATKVCSQQSIKAYVDSGTVTMTNKTLTSPVLNSSISGTAFLDQDAMTDNSATKVCSQQSIKAYVDAQVADYSSTYIETLGLNDGTYNIALPTNNPGTAKFMLGLSSTIIWMYLTTAPPGWKVLSTGSDTLLGVAGGSTYTTAGSGQGSFDHSHTTPDHRHTSPAHVHSVPYTGWTNAASQSSQAQLATCYSYHPGATANKNTLSNAASNTGYEGDAGSGGSSTYRPAASVGKLFQLDTA